MSNFVEGKGNGGGSYLFGESDEEVELSAAEIVEKIVEEVVAIVADGSSCSVGSSGGRDGIIELLLNGTGPALRDCDDFDVNGNGGGSENEQIMSGYINVNDQLPYFLRGEQNHDPTCSAATSSHSNVGRGSERIEVGEKVNVRSSVRDSMEEKGMPGNRKDINSAFTLMQIIVDENKLLRKRVKKMEAWMAFIMSKYRKNVTSLLNDLEHSEKINETMAAALNKKLDERESPAVIQQNTIATEMKEMVINLSKHMNEKEVHVQELVGQLSVENEGLREIHKASKQVGQAYLFQPRDKAVQTEDFASLWIDAVNNSFDETGSFFTAEGISDLESNSGKSSSSSSKSSHHGGSDNERNDDTECRRTLPFFVNTQENNNNLEEDVTLKVNLPAVDKELVE